MGSSIDAYSTWTNADQPFIILGSKNNEWLEEILIWPTN